MNPGPSCNLLLLKENMQILEQLHCNSSDITQLMLNGLLHITEADSLRI